MSHELVGPPVMARSRSGRLRIPRVALQGRRTYVTPSLRPSTVPDTPVDFDSEQFGVCGRWAGEIIHVPEPDADEVFGRFLALHPARSPEDAWSAARAKMPGKFKSYRVLKLFERTLVLPAGEVVFQVEDVPTGKLPDDPPDRIYALCSKAMITQTGARFSLLTPMFDVPPVLEDPVRLMTSAQLTAMQLTARFGAEQHAHRWGWWYLAEKWFEDRAQARAAEAEAKRNAAEARRKSMQEFRSFEIITDEPRVSPGLSPRLRAVEQRARSRMRWGSGEVDEQLVEMRKFLRFDPLVVYETDEAPEQLRMVAHWMKIRDRAGKVHMLIHE